MMDKVQKTSNSECLTGNARDESWVDFSKGFYMETRL
jgi:hypothetical protein